MSLSGLAKMLGLLCVPALALSALLASEPYIVVRILPDWDDSRDTLTLTIIPDRHLSDATIRLDLPGTVHLEPEAGPYRDRFRAREAQEGFRALEAGLGDLPARSALVLAFRPSGHRMQGGVVSFILEGDMPDGSRVREAIGVAVGRPGDRPESRHGALEFPAAPLPGGPR